MLARPETRLVVLRCLWMDVKRQKLSMTRPSSDENLPQIEKQSESNEKPNNQSNRAMDACEIANFLASELFMHQVADHRGLEVLKPLRPLGRQ